MTHRKPWWWRTALVGAVVLGAAIPVSFRWYVHWVDDDSPWFVSVFQGGVFGSCRYELRHCGNVPVSTPGLRLVRNTIPNYEFFTVLPQYSNHYGDILFRLPLHVPLLALLPVVAWPFLPPSKRRRSRRAGLCGACAYDLTGNVSGICPECGTEVKARMRREGKGVVRKVVIAMLTMGAVGTGAAGCLLGRYPYRFDAQVLRTETLVAGATIMDGVLQVSLWRSPSPHTIAMMAETYDRLAKLNRRGTTRNSREARWTFQVEWRQPFGAPYSGDVTGIKLPLLVPTLLFAAYPTLAFIRGPLRRRRRRGQGLCVACAYDLTGNESGVCPECGTEVRS